MTNLSLLPSFLTKLPQLVEPKREAFRNEEITPVDVTLILASSSVSTTIVPVVDCGDIVTIPSANLSIVVSSD